MDHNTGTCEMCGAVGELHYPYNSYSPQSLCAACAASVEVGLSPTFVRAKTTGRATGTWYRADEIVSDWDLTQYASGAYQRDLLRGREAWSGSSLRGKARKYGAHYAESRQNLLKRLQTNAPEGVTIDARLVLVDTYDRRRDCTVQRWKRCLVAIRSNTIEVL